MKIILKNFYTYIMDLIVMATTKQPSEEYFKDFASSLQPTIILATIASPFVILVNTLMTEFSMWVFDSRVYVSVVLIAILVDWFFGSWKHIKKRTFSVKNNALGLMTKIALTVGGGFLFEGVNYLSKDAAFVSVVLEAITRLVVFLYPTLSAFQSIYVISDETFPPKIIIERIQKFNSSLKPSDLSGEEKQEDSPPEEYYD